MKKAGGSAKQNKVYCGKDAIPYEFGAPMQQGRRRDLELVRDQILAGATTEELWDNNFHTMVHNDRALGRFKRIKAPKRNFVTQVLLFVGPTYTHKSHMAHILAESGHFGRMYTAPFAKSGGLRWDNYDGHEMILIDEMNGDRCKPEFMNTLCDRNECSLPVHQTGNVQCMARTIIICSNYAPKYWWRKWNKLDTFMRRISFIWFTGKTSSPVLDDDSEESMTSCHERRMQYEYHSHN